MNRKHIDGAIKSIDSPRRRLVFIASAQTVDRDGDVILTDGIRTNQFEQNPVLLGFHDATAPIGRVLNLTRGTLGNRAPALIAEGEILPEGQSERVDEIWNLVKFGALAGVSVGFLPVPGMFDGEKVLPGQ